MCLRKMKKENFTSLWQLGVLKRKKLITAQRKSFINKVSHLEMLEESEEEETSKLSHCANFVKRV